MIERGWGLLQTEGSGQLCEQEIVGTLTKNAH